MFVQRSPSIISKKINGKWVILEKDKEHIRELNDTAGYIWELVKKPASMVVLAKNVSKRYSIDLKTAEKDVDEFVKQYIKEGFLIETD